MNDPCYSIHTALPRRRHSRSVIRRWARWRRAHPWWRPAAIGCGGLAATAVWLATASPVPVVPAPAYAAYAAPAWLSGLGMAPGPYFGGGGGYLPVGYGGAGGPSGVPVYVVGRAPGNTQTVPEPGSLGLLGAGLLVLVATRRRA